LFATHGFAGTSIRMVAKAANVNVATLAYHFGDKQGLYEAVNVRLHEDLAELAASIDLPMGVDPVLHLVQRAWEFVQDHRLHIRLLQRNLLDHGAHVPAITEEWSEPLLQQADALVMALGGGQELQARLVILSLMHLMARFALEDPEQLRQMLRGADDVDAQLTRFLAGMARKQLDLPSWSGEDTRI